MHDVARHLRSLRCMVTRLPAANRFLGCFIKRPINLICDLSARLDLGLRRYRIADGTAPGSRPGAGGPREPPPGARPRLTRGSRYSLFTGGTAGGARLVSSRIASGARNVGTVPCACPAMAASGTGAAPGIEPVSCSAGSLESRRGRFIVPSADLSALGGCSQIPLIL